jgi:phosphohistidine phosphatase
MELLLIRHGEAVEAAPGLGDPGRWLTGKGRRVTRRVADWLAKRSVRRPAALWTSNLVRAVQTAEIVAGAAGIEDDLIVVPELAPGGDIHGLVRNLASYTGPGPLGLVGHEPGLSLLARQLLGPVDWPGLKKSGVAALSFKPAAEGGRHEAAFHFLLIPKGLKRIRELPPLTDEVPTAA